MKLKDQVCSLEPAKKLKELGVKQDSLFWWTTDNLNFVDDKCTWWIEPTVESYTRRISAFTVAELGEYLREFNIKNDKCLEIEAFDYDINNLKPMNEKDEFHGIKGLHDIRPALKKTSLPPEKIIGEELTQYYNDMKLNFWH
jgi:hypothetical protein